MQVSDIMSRDAQVVSPDTSIEEAAALMQRIDCGFLPVGEKDRLVGMVTDRDIAIRAVARGRGPETAVREVMTDAVRYCYEDDDSDEIARNMAEQQVRRMPVVDRNKRLIGVVALGDLAVRQDGGAAGSALEGISRPALSHP